MMNSIKPIGIRTIFCFVWIVAAGMLVVSNVTAEPIRHDAEHYVLLHQYEEQWAVEDKELEQKLSEIRKKNGGKKPNIVYILIDYVGFGEFGIP